MGEGQTLSRRSVLTAAAGTAAAAAVAPEVALSRVGAHASARTEFLIPRQNIGIQLYSVRDRADADLSGTLAMLAEDRLHGGRAVQLPRPYARTSFRALLDANGLHAVGFHVGADRFRNGARHRARRGGAARPAVRRRVVRSRCLATRTSTSLPTDGSRVSSTPGAKQRPNADCASTSTTTAGTSPSSRGRVLYDVLLEETDDDFVFFELDLYWITSPPVNTRSGPPAATTRPAGRCSTPRIARPTGSFADLGTGTINFARIFSTLENKHYHHYLVERDTLPDSQHTAEVGYEYLRTLRAKRAKKAGRRHA